MVLANLGYDLRRALYLISCFLQFIEAHTNADTHLSIDTSFDGNGKCPTAKLVAIQKLNQYAIQAQYLEFRLGNLHTWGSIQRRIFNKCTKRLSTQDGQKSQ